MTQSEPFVWKTRIYYRDTDAGGMVFHANYLAFMECARSELMQARGFDLGEIARRDRVVFVVHTARITWHKPALLNDAISVTAKLARLSRARIVFEQAVLRESETLAEAELTIACVNADSHRPVAVPEAVCKAFGEAA